jgi:hypothetical protein
VSTAEKPADALYALDSLAGYGTGLWIMCGGRGPSRWSLSEFDLVGVGVVWDHNDDRDLLVVGRSGPVATARRMASTRHKEESLFGYGALACGCGVDDTHALRAFAGCHVLFFLDTTLS